MRCAYSANGMPGPRPPPRLRSWSLNGSITVSGRLPMCPNQGRMVGGVGVIGSCRLLVFLLALSVLSPKQALPWLTPAPSAGSDAQLGMQSGSRQHGILDAKLARRKLQQDVELLSNGVERLRQEERKAKQKVLETKLRGQEIMALQKRNDQAAQAKHLAKQMEEDQRKREMAQLRLERQAARDRIQKAQEAIAVAPRGREGRTPGEGRERADGTFHPRL